MQIIEKIYNVAVNQNPEIAFRYQRYRKKVSGKGRIRAWIYLIKLNIQYHVLRRIRQEVLELMNFMKTKS